MIKKIHQSKKEKTFQIMGKFEVIFYKRRCHPQVIKPHATYLLRLHYKISLFK
jgi:hypothetical protein